MVILLGGLHLSLSLSLCEKKEEKIDIHSYDYRRWRAYICMVIIIH